MPIATIGAIERSRPVQSSLVLLTAADRQMESLLAGTSAVDAFDDNLIRAIMFHDGCVLPDIFAAISTVLERRKSASGRSLLELGLEHGLVRPAFRGNCSTFRESVNLIREQGIQGVQQSAMITASLLDKSFEAYAGRPDRKSAPCAQWPADISRQYGDRVLTSLSHLIDKDVTGDDSARSTLVNMRQVALESSLYEQCNSSISLARRDGLRRGVFLNGLLSYLNQERNSGIKAVDDAKLQLINHPACLDNPTLKSAVEGLVSMANAIYHKNMADSFGARAYFGSDVYRGAASAGLNAASSACYGVRRTGPSSRCTGVGRSFSAKVRLPSTAHLRSVPGETLMHIRRDAGAAYFAALENWLEEGDTCAQQLEAALQNYARALSAQVVTAAPLVKVLFHKLTETECRGFQEVGKLALDCFEHPRSTASALEIVGKIVCYWALERSATIQHETGAKALVI